MIWLFIAAAVAMVLGGILAVKPTKAQQRVAKIREQALRSGLHVKLPVSLRFPSDIEKGNSPFYCRHIREKAFYTAFYVVIREGSRVRTSRGDIQASLKMAIDEILVNASSDIDGFYMGEGLLGFSWRESGAPEILQELCDCLDRAEGLLKANA